MQYIRITPTAHSYFATINFGTIKMTEEEKKKILFDINTYWTDEEHYNTNLKNDIESFDKDLNPIELPKSLFLINNGGYELDDIIKELLFNTSEFNFYHHIVDCIKAHIQIDDEIIIRWEIETDYENNGYDIEDDEDTIREIIRDEYSSLFGSDLDKLDRIMTEIIYIVESQHNYLCHRNNIRNNYYISALDEIEDSLFETGTINIYEDPSWLIKDDCFLDTYDEIELSSKEETKTLQFLIECIRNWELDKAINYINR